VFRAKRVGVGSGFHYGAGGRVLSGLIEVGGGELVLFSGN
jgi:hypothetical protein